MPPRRPHTWLRLTELERRDTPSRPLPFPVIYAGAETGAPPAVKAFDAETGAVYFERTVYEPGFTGGVRVATADFTGDGWPDLAVGPGAGGSPRVRVLDGKTGDPIPGPLGDFYTYETTFTGGVQVAAADVTGDAWPDLVTAAGQGGGPRVRVFDGKTGTQVTDLFVFDPAFAGGLSVAAADFTGDAKAELVVGAGPGGGPHVRVIDLGSGGSIAGPLGSFFAYEAAFAGGVHVGADWKAGDVTGDGRADLLVGPGAGRAPVVKVFSGTTGVQARGFHAFAAGMTAGVRVAAAYVTDDGYADVVVSTGPGVADRVRVFDGQTSLKLTGPTGDFAPFGGARLGGVALAASNDPPLDGDSSGGGGGGSPPPPPASPPPSSTPADTGSAIVYGGFDGQHATVSWEIDRPTADRMDWKYTVHNISILTDGGPGDSNDYGVVTFQTNGYAAGVSKDKITSVVTDDYGTPTATEVTDWARGYEGLGWLGIDPFSSTILPDKTWVFEFSTPPRPVIYGSAWAHSKLNTQSIPPRPVAAIAVPAAPPSVTLTIPEFIPLNANNDNSGGTKWVADTSNTIPLVRDFNAPTPLENADLDLVQATVSVSGDFAGTLDVSEWVFSGDVKLWTDPLKMSPFSSFPVPESGDATVNFYIEGLRTSLSNPYVTLQAKFTTTVGSYYKSVLAHTAVTPIISKFVATPGPTTASKNTPGTVVGMAAGKQATDGSPLGSGGPGIIIRADLITGGFASEGKFVQVATGVTNGVPSSFELTNGVKINFRLANGESFDVSDAPPAAGTAPYYPSDKIGDIIPNPYAVKSFYMVDSPGFAVNIGDSQLSRVNITFNAKTHLTWRFSDNSLYSLAYLTWQVVLAGNLNNGTFIVDAASKVTATDYTLSNEDPSKLVAPYFNNLFDYYIV